MQIKYLFIPVISALLLSACQADPFETTSGNVETPKVQTPTDDAIAGELIIKFKPGAGDILDLLPATRAGGQAATRSGIARVDETLDEINTQRFERVFVVDIDNEERTREAGLHLWYLVRFDEGADLATVANQLLALDDVADVAYNRRIQRINTKPAIPLASNALKATRAATRAGATFNDPLLERQWNIVNTGTLPGYTNDPSVLPESKVTPGADVGVADAWSRSSGDPSIIVAVLDEGVMYDHPDLADNMWINPKETFRSRQDNDGNGYAGDYYGYNFVFDTGIITYDNIYDSGHGTHVAGVIAAVNNNGIGISSIAGGNKASGIPGVKIMSCQVYSGNYGSSSINIARAVKYAADNGAVILQCSWGFNSAKANSLLFNPGFETDEEWIRYSPLEFSAMDYFHHNAGSPDGVIEGGILVFAGGNEYAPMASYPGAYKNYVGVAATAPDLTPPAYTNYGPGTNISAPGGDQDYYSDYILCSEDCDCGCNGSGIWAECGDCDGILGIAGSILSTLPPHVAESYYGYMEGTSMACPHVSGVVALGLSYALQQRRHFKADEFKELLYSSAVDFETLLKGDKTTYKYISLFGKMYLTRTPLSNYRGRMGTGQVNAANLLTKIENGGTELKFPNLYINLGSAVTVSPAMYFEGGQSLTYSVTIADENIAKATVENGIIKVEGRKEGVTTGTVTAGGVSQKFAVTVRTNANGNGWM